MTKHLSLPIYFHLSGRTNGSFLASCTNSLANRSTPNRFGPNRFGPNRFGPDKWIISCQLYKFAGK